MTNGDDGDHGPSEGDEFFDKVRKMVGYDKLEKENKRLVARNEKLRKEVAKAKKDRDKAQAKLGDLISKL